MTTTSQPRPDDVTDPADPVGRAARVDALRAALAGDTLPSRPGRPSALVETVGPVDPDGADELAERLRRRRSAAHVAAAYSAANGHPLDRHAPTTRRWALDVRTAVAAACALLLVAVVTAGLALWPQESGDLVELAAHDRGAGGVADGGVGGGVDAEDDGGDDGGVEPVGQGSAAPGTLAGASPDPGSGGTPVPGEAGSTVVVHVVGKVADPGLVTLPVGARVADALDAAGGATKGADLTQLNLARTVVDGEQVHVLAPGETPPPVTAAGGTTNASGSTSGAAAAGATGSAPGALVPINTADVAALDTLPGVGPVLAERIVAWRDANGPFASVDELTEVSGIGPSVLEGLRDLVVV